MSMRLPPQLRATVSAMAGAILRDVIAELMLIEPGQYIAHIENGQIANIRDIVASSSELHLAPDTLIVADQADYELDWDSRPRVTLNLILHHAERSIALELRLGQPTAEVNIGQLTGFDLTGDALAQFEAFFRQCRRDPLPDTSHSG